MIRFKTLEKVTIYRKSKKAGTCWTDYMNKFVGLTGTILEISPCGTAVSISFPKEISLNAWYVPISCIKHYKEIIK